MRLLIAEDDPKMRTALKRLLENNQYVVDSVSDGWSALRYAETAEYDGLILDIAMPGVDGLEVLRQLRSQGVSTPALFLTAMAEIPQRVAGLDAGADDYLSKPCATPELLARVRAMLRRKENYLPDLLTVGGLALNRSTYELSWQGKSQSLSGQEFQILEMLMERPGFVVTTNQLLFHVWGWDSDVDCSVVWVHISNIRKKLARLGAPAGIRFLRGAGYVLEGGAIEKGAALGGSFFLMGTKKRPALFAARRSVRQDSLLGTGPRALSADEPHGEDGAGGGLFPIDELDQRQHRLLPHLVNGLGHGADAAVLRNADAVKANQGQGSRVIRGKAPQGSLDAGGQHIAGSEDAVGVGIQLSGVEDVLFQMLAKQILCFHVIRIAGAACLAAGFQKTLVPSKGRYAAGDNAVAKKQRRFAAAGQQLLGCQHTAFVVVAGHGGHTLYAALDTHQGDIPPVEQLIHIVTVPRAHQNPGHVVGLEGGELLQFPLLVAAGNAQEELVARMGAGLLYGGGEGAEKGVVDIGDNQADDVAVLIHQGARHLVGIVVQLPHHLEHLILCLLADRALPI